MTGAWAGGMFSDCPIMSPAFTDCCSTSCVAQIIPFTFLIFTVYHWPDWTSAASLFITVRAISHHRITVAARYFSLICFYVFFWCVFDPFDSRCFELFFFVCCWWWWCLTGYGFFAFLCSTWSRSFAISFNKSRLNIFMCFEPTIALAFNSDQYRQQLISFGLCRSCFTQTNTFKFIIITIYCYCFAALTIIRVYNLQYLRFFSVWIHFAVKLLNCSSSKRIKRSVLNLYIWHFDASIKKSKPCLLGARNLTANYNYENIICMHNIWLVRCSRCVHDK